MTIAAVIVAAGKGLRAGAGTPKQYRMLAGRAVLTRCIQVFIDHPQISQVVVILKPADQRLFDRLVAPHFTPGELMLVDGGDSRRQSVSNGLQALEDKGFTKVLIQDGARPLTSTSLISRIITALNHAEAAAPALEITDALWRGKDDFVTGIQDRAGLFRAQTPQGFDFGKILQAHRQNQAEASDDVEIARHAGLNVAIIAGDIRNIKITRPEDFAQAERYLGAPMDIRTGTGFDVHAFCPGDHVMLCGIKIPHSKALLGHSDADVAMHAVTDAIYGAMAAGDIGRWFPPSETKWKGAASDIFLKHAVGLAREKGFMISNIDCTIICELPKITPHAMPMRARMAEILEIDMERVSVKATTSEKLGFTGRGEGIAAQASATLVHP